MGHAEANIQNCSVMHNSLVRYRFASPIVGYTIFDKPVSRCVCIGDNKVTHTAVHKVK
jgi:hypothetical protein